VIAIPEAYTPIIKFHLLGFAIDLLFVALPLPEIPTNFYALSFDASCLDEQV